MTTQYVLHFTDPLTAPFVINPYTSNGRTGPISSRLESSASSARTSLLFYGKGHPNYGERIEEGVLHLLENFSGATAPTQPVSGQLWFERRIFVHTSTTPSANWYKWDDASSSWVGISVLNIAPTTNPASAEEYRFSGGVLYSSTNTPGHPLQNQWIVRQHIEDTTFNISSDLPQKTLKIYNGTEWVRVNDVWTSELSPTNPTTGTLWFNPVAGELNIYDGTSYQTFNSTVGIGNLYVQKTGDTMTGELILEGQPAYTPGPLVTPHSAATKQYVQDAIASFNATNPVALGDLLDVTLSVPGTNQLLSFNGTTWVNSTATLSLISDVTATPTEVNHLAGVTSNVQTQLDEKLNLAGGTLTGSLTMMGSTSTVTLATQPTQPMHAATKQYVDQNHLSSGFVTSGTLVLQFGDGSTISIPGFDNTVVPYSPIEGDILNLMAIPPVDIVGAVQRMDKAVRRRTTPNRIVTEGTTASTYTVPPYEVGSGKLFVFVDGLKFIASTQGFQRVRFALDPLGIGSPPIATPEQLDCSLAAGLTPIVGSPALTYQVDIYVDGASSPQTISIEGEISKTICEVLNEINAQLTGATAVLEDNAIVIYSETKGTGSSILIDETPYLGSPNFGLFSSMRWFDDFDSPINGTTYGYNEEGATGTISTFITFTTPVDESVLEFIVLGGTGAAYL